MSSVQSWSSRIACLLLIGVFACGDSSGPKTNPPATIVAAAGNTQVGPAGRALANPLVVRVNDSQGKPLSGVAVTFTVLAGNGTVSATSAQTEADGTVSASWTLGTVAGAEQRVQASAAKPDGTSLNAVFNAIAQVGPAAAVVKVAGDGQNGGTGAALRDSLVIRVTDEFGNGVPGVSVTWAAPGAVTSPTVSVTNDAGRAATRWTLGDNLGAFTSTASSGAIAPITFNATATLTITQIAPAELVPGDVMTLTGVGFTPGTTANTITIGGVSATVQAATATSITALVPASLPCSTGNVALSLVSGGVTTNRNHRARGAAPLAVTVGQVIIGSSANPLTCFELPQGGGRYVIAVTNTNTSGGSSSLRLRGTSESATPAQVTLAAPQAFSREARDPTGVLARHAHHTDVLDKSRAVLTEAMRSGGGRAALRAQPAAQQIVPVVGDTMSIRVPRLSAGNLCASYDSIRARVVAVGTRGVVLEDVTNPFAGAIDSLYQRLSQDFDATQYDRVKNNFGDPLLRDQQLDNNGRLLMVFTQRVNATPGVLGFAFGGDLVQRTGPGGCLQSNVGEVFYGRVPTVNSQEYAQGTITEWYWTIRTTVVHEVKHIASFAERLENGSTQLEELWLEEATAMLVEELWARGVFGYAQRGNTGFSQSVGCEIRGLFNQSPCEGRPGVTWSHFGFLADWMDSPSTRTMLCRSNNECSESSFYGSGWMFLRWLLDQSNQPEDVLLRAMHTTTAVGVQNLQARFGRPFDELITEWALAVALDDRPGFTSPSAAYTMPSWNLRDVYGELNRTQGHIYPVAFPLNVTTFSYGNADMNVSSIRLGAAAFFELSGTPQGRQVLEFTGASGAALGNGLRVSIVRVQ